MIILKLRRFTWIIFSVLPVSVFTQESPGWHHLSPKHDNILGVGTYKANELLKNRQADTVIVAVLDNGAEINHEDLNEVIWTNPGEIPGNHIDDDNNGYVDDVHGWNFLGNSKGENLKYETLGLTRLYNALKRKYKKERPGKVSDKTEYFHYLKIKEEFKKQVEEKQVDLDANLSLLKSYYKADKIIRHELGKRQYTISEVLEMKTNKEKVVKAQEIINSFNEHQITSKKLEREIEKTKKELKTRLNPKYKGRRKYVGDNPDDINDSIYGNNHIGARGPYHGTGIASIIGAAHNNKGINGVAGTIKLMILRIVPNGDERDKDIALAIRYAVRNGAKIINCSFAKKYPLHYNFVQDALEEAENAGVLIVHAAGNDGINLDEVPFYPTGIKKNREKANNWITVGASRAKDNQSLPAFFTNYGKKSVDIFAPGYAISTCALNNGYGTSSGTSSAAPVVAGIAAVLKAYYPHLEAARIKEIIMRSAYIPTSSVVYLPGSKNKSLTTFDQLCVSGGIASLYNAVSLIEKEYLK